MSDSSSYNPSTLPPREMEMVQYDEFNASGDIISTGSCPRYVVRYMRDEQNKIIKIKGEDE